DTLKALMEEEEALREDVDSVDLDDALLSQHREVLTEGISAVHSKEANDQVGDALSALIDLEENASTLEGDLAALDGDIEDIANDLIAAHWTNSQYARGQRVLDAHKDRVPDPDLGFLVPYEAGIEQLTSDGQATFKSAVRQYTLATTTDYYRDHDCSPVIA